MIDTKTVLENKTDGYLAEDSQVKGGWLTVQTLEERDAILPVALKVGSLCYCTATSKFYVYDGSSWAEKQMGGGGGGGSTIKYNGQIIRSKTLDTEEKVITRYEGNHWELIGDEDGVYQWKRDDTPAWLTVEAVEDCEFAYGDDFGDTSMKYTLDNGLNWYSWTPETPISILAGKRLGIKNLTNKLNDENQGFYFYGTGKYKLLGNIMSLLNFSGTLYPWCFALIFIGETDLVDISKLRLPATTLASNCYYSMFNGTSITSIPSGFLPATTLAGYCYENMFVNCRLLETVPLDLLPATDLSDCVYCYADMFANCSKLKKMPNLPATTLATGCYLNMFYGCTSLSISEGSGDHKFFTCPDTTPDNCVDNMFNGTGGTYTANPVTGHDYYYND